MKGIPSFKFLKVHGRKKLIKNVVQVFSSRQGCGSAFTLCGSGSGSSSFSECGSGSGSRSRSSLTKFEGKKSWRVFLSCKKTKRLLKSKKQGSLCKFTFKKFNKVVVICIFLVFSWHIYPPTDPGGKMNADPCGSGSTALLLQHVTPISFKQN